MIDYFHSADYYYIISETALTESIIILNFIAVFVSLVITYRYIILIIYIYRNMEYGN